MNRDALREAARRFGTPSYVTDVAEIDRAVEELEAAFPDPWLRAFSLKANDGPGVIRLLAERGLGGNVVSRGEWRAASRAGLPNDRITLEGVGKTDADLRAAVRAARDGRPLRWVAVESPDELAVLGQLAERTRIDRPIDVLLRLNPDVTPETQAGLAVGRGASKFGMTETELTEAVDRGAGPAVALRGIHLHVGSQLGAVDAWRDGLRRALALLALVRGGLPSFDTLDAGGGFPVGAAGEQVPSPARFAREVGPHLDALPADRRPDRLAVEPGRFLVARAGVLLARVLHARERGGRQVVLDAGMTELIRPALYGARHPIVALTSLGRAVDAETPPGAQPPGAQPTQVEGPICESTDSLGVHDLPPLRRGDLVAILDAGAYAASMSSRYNGRRRPAQVLVPISGPPQRLR